MNVITLSLDTKWRVDIPLNIINESIIFIFAEALVALRFINILFHPK